MRNKKMVKSNNQLDLKIAKKIFSFFINFKIYFVIVFYHNFASVHPICYKVG